MQTTETFSVFDGFMLTFDFSFCLGTFWWHRELWGCLVRARHSAGEHHTKHVMQTRPSVRREGQMPS